MVVLDTDHLSLLEWKSSAQTQRLQARLDQIPAEETATTILSFEEQMRGWMTYLAQARSLTEQVEAYRRLGRQLANYCDILILEFDERAAAEFQRLKRSRLRLGTMDMKIAAVVLTHDATLLTRNQKDFSKVPGLKIADWTG
jgi:tRNA(fMet)-specific endonuclease VapC